MVPVWLYDLQATLFEAQRSDLQGTGKNVSASGAVRGEEDITKVVEI